MSQYDSIFIHCREEQEEAGEVVGKSDATFLCLSFHTVRPFPHRDAPPPLPARVRARRHWATVSESPTDCIAAAAVKPPPRRGNTLDTAAAADWRLPI